MSDQDHTHFADDPAAFLLGALDDGERADFERHMAGCVACREEVERLRPAAEALPRSAPPVEPPPSLKRSLLEVVESDVREREAAERPPLRERLRSFLPSLSGARPAVAWASAVFLVAVGLAAGVGVNALKSNDDPHTFAAKVDHTRLPVASGSLQVSDSGRHGGILRIHGLPGLARNRVYQAWVQRDGEVVPQASFEPGSDGTAAAALTEDLQGADFVMITREPRGGSRAPGERPVLTVKL
jgi:anti-sigma-K factor RskA